MSRRVSTWRPDAPDAEARLDNIAADHLAVLHRTLREDPAAFGLYEAISVAGERLTTAASDTWALSRDDDDFAARFTAVVGGDGGTMADAAVRRAAATSAGQLLKHLEQHPEAGAPPGGGNLAGDLFCLLYQWFFADAVAEFLRIVVAEKVKLVVPLLPAFDPEDHLADWVAEQVLSLLPNPCEEAAELKGTVEKAEEVVSAVEDPIGALRLVARALVPRAAGWALGLLGDEERVETAETVGSDVTPYEGDPAA